MVEMISGTLCYKENNVLKFHLYTAIAVHIRSVIKLSSSCNIIYKRKLWARRAASLSQRI